jgi:hypothetical protein
MEHTNTDANITGILKSLTRELNKVKMEIARMNKTTEKGNWATGPDRTGMDNHQAGCAKSSPTSSNILNKDPSYVATTAAGNQKDRPQGQQMKYRTADKLE